MLTAVAYNTSPPPLPAGTPEDVLVAPVKVFERDDGTAWTVTFWSAERCTLLPEVDAVRLHSPDTPGGGFTVLWKDLLETATEHVSLEEGTVPQRWRAPRWPGPETIATLLLAGVSAIATLLATWVRAPRSPPPAFSSL